MFTNWRCNNNNDYINYNIIKNQWSIPPTELKTRKDLRDLDVVSVDPPGCKDIDDALHCRLLPNNNLEIGVHIADVTYFVRPNTAIDREAAHRCTTVYLVDRRTDIFSCTPISRLLLGNKRQCSASSISLQPGGSTLTTSRCKSLRVFSSVGGIDHWFLIIL